MQGNLHGVGKWGESGDGVVTAGVGGASEVQDATRVKAWWCREPHPVSGGVVTEVVSVRRGLRRRTRKTPGRRVDRPVRPWDGWRLRADGVAHTLRRVAGWINLTLWEGS
ncbi:hypothetical protein GCM10022206_22720 [Streptomyces chiangmaiensis]